MTQISPPVTRAVSVLNFLAEHAEQAFTLSEIAKSLRISSATCHNLLTALTDAGYLYRTAGKTYVLGPALARVSQAALAPAVTMQVARPEMRLLADEFDVVCSASFLVDDKIIVRERASSVSHLNWHKQSLTVHSLASSGAMFLAWDDAALARWQANEAASLDAATTDRVEQSLAFLRARGFTFGVRKVPLVDAKQAQELQYQADMTDHAPASLEPDELYQLGYVVSPVFARPGAVAFSLSLTGFTAPLRGAAVEAMGERLRSACDRIGAFIAGRELR